MNLIKQDVVYVPIKIEDWVNKDGTELSVPLISRRGLVTQAFTFDLPSYNGKEFSVLKPIKQVYVLTDLEIKMILEQYKTALLSQENILHPIIDDFVNSITQ